MNIQIVHSSGLRLITGFSCFEAARDFGDRHLTALEWRVVEGGSADGSSDVPDLTDLTYNEIFGVEGPSAENVAFENLMAAFVAYRPFEADPEDIFEAIRENLVDRPSA